MFLFNNTIIFINAGCERVGVCARARARARISTKIECMVYMKLVYMKLLFPQVYMRLLFPQASSPSPQEASIRARC